MNPYYLSTAYITNLSYCNTMGPYQGRIQDFMLGGAHLKKLRRAEGGAKIVGVFRVKNHDFTPKKSARALLNAPLHITCVKNTDRDYTCIVSWTFNPSYDFALKEKLIIQHI